MHFMGENARDGSPSEQAAPPLFVMPLLVYGAHLPYLNAQAKCNVEDGRVAHV